MGRRLLPVALLIALWLALAPAASSAYGEHVLGPQRILVGLVTWGPQPFVRDDVRNIVFNEVDASYRSMSYGKMPLTGTVTPWLKAVDGAGVGCNLPKHQGARECRPDGGGIRPVEVRPRRLRASGTELPMVRCHTGGDCLSQRRGDAASRRARARSLAGAGVIMRVSASPDHDDGAIPDELLSNHKTAPRAPRFTAAVVGGRVQVTFDGKVRETGSGVARYDITLDRRAPLSVGTDAANAPVEVGRPLPGTHTVRVVAVDRAGNRSAAGVRQIRVS